eukprot:gene13307-9144_t
MHSLRAIGISSPVAPHTLSAQLASGLSTACFYPFDVLKTRFMSQDGTVARQHNGMTYHSMRQSLLTIYREEGPRTLFRGLPVALCGAMTAWGLYMACYRFLCNATETTSYLGRSGVSMLASMISTLVSCPIFLIKSRMQLEEATGKHRHYNSFRSGLRHTITTGGVRSLWRGGTLHLWLVFPYCFNIPTYDFLKAQVLRYRGKEVGSEHYAMSLPEVALCSAATKVVVLLLSHPMIMVRVRLQDQRSLSGPIQYARVSQSVATILRTQGVLGMYRGFFTALAHTMPRSHRPLSHWVLQATDVEEWVPFVVAGVQTSSYLQKVISENPTKGGAGLWLRSLLALQEGHGQRTSSNEQSSMMYYGDAIIGWQSPPYILHFLRLPLQIDSSISQRCCMSASRPTDAVGRTAAQAPEPRPTTGKRQHVYASQAAGAASTLLLHPVDVVRTRFISQDYTVERRHNGLTYRRVLEAFARIYKDEGWRAFFRGCHVSILGSVCAWGVYMACYRAWTGASRCPSPLAASLGASIVSAAVCNPIWLMKTRMELAEGAWGGRAAAPAASQPFLTLRSGVLFTLRTTGLSSFWRGTTAQILLGVPHAVTLPLYELLRRRLLLYRGESPSPNSLLDVVLCSTVAKSCVCVAAHPLLLLKTRLQDHRARRGPVQYTSLRQALRTSVELGGVPGLFRGVASSLLHTVPRAVLFYVLYEQCLYCLPKSHRSSTTHRLLFSPRVRMRDGSTADAFMLYHTHRPRNTDDTESSFSSSSASSSSSHPLLQETFQPDRCLSDYYYFYPTNFTVQPLSLYSPALSYKYNDNKARVLLIQAQCRRHPPPPPVALASRRFLQQTLSQQQKVQSRKHQRDTSKPRPMVFSRSPTPAPRSPVPPRPTHCCSLPPASRAVSAPPLKGSAGVSGRRTAVSVPRPMRCSLSPAAAPAGRTTTPPPPPPEHHSSIRPSCRRLSVSHSASPPRHRRCCSCTPAAVFLGLGAAVYSQTGISARASTLAGVAAARQSTSWFAPSSVHRHPAESVPVDLATAGSHSARRPWALRDSQQLHLPPSPGGDTLYRHRGKPDPLPALHHTAGPAKLQRAFTTVQSAVQATATRPCTAQHPVDGGSLLGGAHPVPSEQSAPSCSALASQEVPHQPRSATGSTEERPRMDVGGRKLQFALAEAEEEPIPGEAEEQAAPAEAEEEPIPGEAEEQAAPAEAEEESIPGEAEEQAAPAEAEEEPVPASAEEQLSTVEVHVSPVELIMDEPNPTDPEGPTPHAVAVDAVPLAPPGESSTAPMDLGRKRMRSGTGSPSPSLRCREAPVCVEHTSPLRSAAPDPSTTRTSAALPSTLPSEVREQELDGEDPARRSPSLTAEHAVQSVLATAATACPRSTTRPRGAPSEDSRVVLRPSPPLPYLPASFYEVEREIIAIANSSPRVSGLLAAAGPLVSTDAMKMTQDLPPPRVSIDLLAVPRSAPNSVLTYPHGEAPPVSPAIAIPLPPPWRDGATQTPFPHVSPPSSALPHAVPVSVKLAQLDAERVKGGLRLVATNTADATAKSASCSGLRASPPEGRWTPYPRTPAGRRDSACGPDPPSLSADSEEVLPEPGPLDILAISPCRGVVARVSADPNRGEEAPSKGEELAAALVMEAEGMNESMRISTESDPGTGCADVPQLDEDATQEEEKMVEAQPRCAMRLGSKGEEEGEEEGDVPAEPWLAETDLISIDATDDDEEPAETKGADMLWQPSAAKKVRRKRGRGVTPRVQRKLQGNEPVSSVQHPPQVELPPGWVPPWKPALKKTTQKPHRHAGGDHAHLSEASLQRFWCWSLASGDRSSVESRPFHYDYTFYYFSDFNSLFFVLFLFFFLFTAHLINHQIEAVWIAFTYKQKRTIPNSSCWMGEQSCGRCPPPSLSPFIVSVAVSLPFLLYSPISSSRRVVVFVFLFLFLFFLGQTYRFSTFTSNMSMRHHSALTALFPGRHAWGALRSLGSKATMSFGIDPAKLDLQLSLDKTDFAAMAEATAAAQMKERQVMEDILRSSSTVPAAVASSSLTSEGANRTVRGVVDAGAVHDSRNPGVAYAQHRAENPDVRYTLLDALNDCTVTNNWAKAYGMFDSALNKALAAVPAGRSEGLEGVLEPSKEHFAALYQINAMSPPGPLGGSRNNLVGVMRWRCFHYLALLRLLVKCNRWKEVAAVWDVLHRIGVVKFHMDAKFANSIISTIRRGTSGDHSAEEVADDEIKSSPLEVDAGAKATARRIVLEVEAVAKERNLRLNRSNVATAQQARIAEAVRQAQEQGASLDFDLDAEEPTKPGLVAAGDFTGLLRRATSHRATNQILEVMERLGLALDGTAYACIIASLQNPLYLVENALPEELQSNYATDGSQSSSRPSPEEIQSGKERYELYRQKRVKSAREWFEKCPRDQWNSMLFNEYLYLLRGRDQASEFDRVLTLFRGSPLFSEAALRPNAPQETIPPPQWKAAPDAKTYELLLYRARYLHQWQAMWDLLDEMRSEHVRGTGRVYQMLMAEAKVHPPTELLGNREGIARLTIDLYSEMRSQHKDIHSVDSHIDVINAWSVTRRRQ